MSGAAAPSAGAGLADVVRESLLLGDRHDVDLVFEDVALGRVAHSAGVALGADVPAVVSIGAFDGVHAGHRALAEATVADARSRGCLAVALTFDPDPADVLPGAAAEPHLLEVEDRVRGLALLGFDAVVALRFDDALAALDPAAFVRDCVRSLVSPLAVHVGDNFRFGARGAGDVSTLAELGRELGFDVVAHELLLDAGERVSASRVRAAVRAGKVDLARRLLARPHFVRGEVVHGRGEGASLGFATANVRVRELSCLPKGGVFAGAVVLGGRAWPAAINVGAPPTFAAPDELFLEAHLIGFEGDLYGRACSVVLLSWLRESRPFSSTEELVSVVRGNIDWVRTNVGTEGVEVSA